jgi:hypothetical protein
MPVLGRSWLRPVYVAVSLILGRRIRLLTRRFMDNHYKTKTKDAKDSQDGTSP